MKTYLVVGIIATAAIVAALVYFVGQKKNPPAAPDTQHTQKWNDAYDAAVAVGWNDEGATKIANAAYKI